MPFAPDAVQAWPALLALFVCLTTAQSVQASPTIPRLSVDSEIATAGFFRLSWETGAEHVELQEARDPDFRNPATIYSGPDRASVISGKPDGAWYYRIRAVTDQQPGPWSQPLNVAVSHHSLERALAVLAVGITVFAAIVVMNIRGSGKTG